MNTELSIFAFGDHIIRTVEHQGTPWFVATDVCAILELGNVSQAITGNSRAGAHGLDEDERGIYNLATPSGIQEMLIVSEPGLYRLAFKSRKHEAKVFQKWVFSEVLPQIRRTGSYNSAHQAYLGLIADQLRMGVSPDLAARCASKLCPAVAILPKRFAHEPSSDSELQEILDLMQPDTAYSIEDVVRLLPAGHRLRRGNKHAQASAVGKVMIRGRGQSRLQKIPGRYAKYQLPSIVAITAERS